VIAQDSRNNPATDSIVHGVNFALIPVAEQSGDFPVVLVSSVDGECPQLLAQRRNP